MSAAYRLQLRAVHGEPQALAALQAGRDAGLGEAEGAHCPSIVPPAAAPRAPPGAAPPARSEARPGRRPEAVGRVAAVKLIHTADWHLGRLFFGLHLTADQEHVLDQLVDLVADVRPHAVLLAGDIYDRAVPPTDAVALLDDVLERVVLGLGVPVVIIAGNHDSPERLGFASALLRERGLPVGGPPRQPRSRAARRARRGARARAAVRRARRGAPSTTTRTCTTSRRCRRAAWRRRGRRPPPAPARCW